MERLEVGILRKLPLNKGDSIFTLIDAGSMGGIEEEWKYIKDDIRVIGFEPDEREFMKLENTEHLTYFNSILSSKSEDLGFYILHGPGKSSIYEPNIDRLKEFPNVERFDMVDKKLFKADKVQKLDVALITNNIRDVDFLKLDTQGSELLILQGSEQILENSILGLKIEVEFFEIYKNQPLFSDVDLFMRGKGFELIDIRRHFWKRSEYTDFRGKGQIIFGDALYFKRIDLFLDQIERMERSFATSKIVKFIVICVVYGMHDYAIAILNGAIKRGLIDGNVGYDLIQMINEYDKKKNHYIRFLPWRNRWLILINRLQKLLSKKYLDWADSDSILGNR